MPGPVEDLRLALRADPARPLLTHYDDATGERTELSVVTTENWVAKTANLLVDDLAAAPGDDLGLALPLHWQTAVWALAAWSAGLRVVVGAPDDPAVTACPVVVVDAPGLAVLDGPGGAGAAVPEVVACSLHPMGAGLGEAAGRAVDYAAEVLSHGDRFVPLPATGGPALLVDGSEVGLDGLGVLGAEAAVGWGLGAGGRLLTTLDPRTRAGLLALVVAPLSMGASVVTVRNADPARAERRAHEEKVTATAG